MNTELATVNDNSYAIIERVAVLGDLSPLTPKERVQYYTGLCQSLGLNPFTKPFEYLQLDNKLVLYATRGATDQLRDIKGVSITLVGKEANTELGVYTVEVQASTADGRRDFATGTVAIQKEIGEWKTSNNNKRYFAGTGQWETLRGVELANALMKAETKAKRRATLSICGLGWMDESEVGDAPRAQRMLVDHETGEVQGDLRTKLKAELRELAQQARDLGLDPGLGKPAEMSDEELSQSAETLRQMIAAEQKQRASYETVEQAA